MKDLLKKIFRRNASKSRSSVAEDISRHSHLTRLRSLERNMQNAWSRASQGEMYNHGIRADYETIAQDYMALCRQHDYQAEAIQFFASLPDAGNLITLARHSSPEDILLGLRPTSRIEGITAPCMIELLILLIQAGITHQDLNRNLGILGIAMIWKSEPLFALGRAWGEIQIPEAEHQATDIVQAIEGYDASCVEGLASLIEDAASDPRKATALRSMTDGYIHIPVKTVLALLAVGISPAPGQARAISQALSASSLSAHARLGCETGTVPLREILKLRSEDISPHS